MFWQVISVSICFELLATPYKDNASLFFGIFPSLSTTHDKCLWCSICIFLSPVFNWKKRGEFIDLLHRLNGGKSMRVSEEEVEQTLRYARIIRIIFSDIMLLCSSISIHNCYWVWWRNAFTWKYGVPKLKRFNITIKKIY